MVPASAVRLGVEGATEEMGAGAGTQTPGAPTAGRSAAATRQGKHALSHDDSAAPRMAPLTAALKSTNNNMSASDEAVAGASSLSASRQLAGVHRCTSRTLPHSFSHIRVFVCV